MGCYFFVLFLIRIHVPWVIKKFRNIQESLFRFLTLVDKCILDAQGPPYHSVHFAENEDVVLE